MTEQEAQAHYENRFGAGSDLGRAVRLWWQAQDHHHYGWSDWIGCEILDTAPLSIELEAIYPPRRRCEWSILLGTGGPADRVLVTTGNDGCVESATYQHQDWFTPWTDAPEQDADLVSRFAEHFYYQPLDEMNFHDQPARFSA